MAAHADTSATTAPRPRRRWFQFRLRTLLVLLTLCALGFAWLAAQWRQHVAELRALRAIGATALAVKPMQVGTMLVPLVEGDHNPANGRNLAFLYVPAWLAKLPGVSSNGVFSRVQTLVLGAPDRIAPISDDEWRHLDVFDDLLLLTAEGRRIDADDVRHFARMANLKTLNLIGCTFEPDAFAPFGELQQLNSLDLDGSNVTDADLAALSHLDQLESLGLGHTQVTDEGLVHLRSLNSLRSLDLAGSRVTDEGVERLRQALPQLDLLDD